MLKIWLTWLQPRLGVFGTALVLSNPVYSYAAPKPAAVTNTTKVPAQPTPWSIVKSTGTTLDREILSGVAVTPDVAVRQLAVNSMTTSGMLPNISAIKTVRPNISAVAIKTVRPNISAVAIKTARPNISAAKSHQHNRKAVAANLAAPSAKFKKLSARTAKPQPVKNSVAAALARAIDPKTPLPVPGLFIGNTDVRVSERMLPSVKPMPQPMSSAPEIGAPTPLSAMMSAKTAVDPFPVVRPELMGKLQSAPVVISAAAKNSAPHALNPIATIPNGRPQSVGPKQTELKSDATHSLDPIAAIPSGLQRLLGNNLGSQPKMAIAPVATVKTAPKSTSSLLALKPFIAPTAPIAPTEITTASLQLATAQAYTSVPKFDIPGEKILAVKPSVNLLGVNRSVAQKNLKLVKVETKHDYVASIEDRRLTPATTQSWTVVDRRSNLGGLILGSQALATVPKVIGLLPTSSLANSATIGLPARSLANFN